MMKQLIFMMVILSNIIACDGQTQTNHKNTLDKMKTFDIEKFEENKGKQGYDDEYHYKLKDTSEVREYSTTINANSNELVFQREITKEFSPLKYYYTYYKNTSLYSEVNEFNNSVLLAKEYDKNGKLIKETNFDKSFKHTFDQIHEIVLKEKKVDIYDTRQAVALRHDTPDAALKKYYQIHVLKSELVGGEWYSQPNYSFLIDDETGKILNK